MHKRATDTFGSDEHNSNPGALLGPSCGHLIGETNGTGVGLKKNKKHLNRLFSVARESRCPRTS